MRRRHFRCDAGAASASQGARAWGGTRTPCDNNMAQLFGIKTPVAAFMADSPILLA